MPALQEDAAESPFPVTPQARARQWSRTAWAMALLFASLPVACRIFVGVWGFEGAFQVSCVCVVLGAFFYLRGRKSLPAAPDPATLLDRAIQLASLGETEEAMLLLTEAIRLSPRLWQAFQYRGELYLRQSGNWEQARQDLNQAIQLAPDEPYLYVLRAHAHAVLGDDLAARRDSDTASQLQSAASARNT
jgi:tetratricopeptide (TPR) repeat protein